MKQLKIAIVIMAMCMFGVAQTKTADKKPAEKSAMSQDHDKAAGMEMQKPAPEIQKMYDMLGNWAATIKTEPAQNRPIVWDRRGPGSFPSRDRLRP